MKSNDYGKIYFVRQQSYKDKIFSPIQEINSNFDLLKSIELGTGRGIGITSNDELLEWKYEKKGSNLKRQEFPYLLSKPVYHFHKIKFGKVLMNKTMCLGVDIHGSVLVWGEHKDGLLGLGYTINSIENPTKIDNLREICEIALSDNHAIAINTSGDAFSWGTGKYGELGLEKSIYTPTPLRVNGSRIYSKVIVGNLITCFLDTEGHFSYFGVIIKILKGCFSTITVKNLLNDQSNSDPNTLFQEKIIDELENELFVTVAIGNGFIALLSKKGMVYTLEYSDKLTLLYSKYFIYSLTVSNNQIIGLSYDKYCSSQTLNDQTSQLNQQLYYLCQWISKASDQDVSNEIWFTIIYRITEELHLDNILLINSNNRNIILFFEKGMNLNTSVLFPNRVNENISNDISWDNITYNDLPVGTLGLMRKNTQNHNFLVFDSEYDDSYNMKFKRSKLVQIQKNTSRFLNRTMFSEVKSSNNIFFNKSSSSSILGPFTERNNNKRLLSSDLSNRKFIPNDDESVDMKEKELQDYQKEIDSIISNFKSRQKDKSSSHKRNNKEYRTLNPNDSDLSLNTEGRRRDDSLISNTLPNETNQRLKMNKTDIGQLSSKDNAYNNLNNSNANMENKHNMSEIDGLFNKTRNENSNNNTEIRNDVYNDPEEVNAFNKSNCNILDERNQLKISPNIANVNAKGSVNAKVKANANAKGSANTYENQNKIDFLSPQLSKTNKMNQLYSNQETGSGIQLKDGKIIGSTIEDKELMKKLQTNQERARFKKLNSNNPKYSNLSMKYYQQKLLNASLINEEQLMKHYNTETNEMDIFQKINTEPTQNGKMYEIYEKSPTSDSGIRIISPHYIQEFNKKAKKRGNPYQIGVVTNKRGNYQLYHSLSYGYKINDCSRNNNPKQIYEIEEDDYNHYESNKGRKKYYIMKTFDENDNKPSSDRAHYLPSTKNYFSQENDYLESKNTIMKLNKQKGFRKIEDSNKMSTIVHMENSSNFACSNDNIFEDTPKFEAKNLLHFGKEIKSKAPDAHNKRIPNNKIREGIDDKFDNKSNIADSSDNEGNGPKSKYKQLQNKKKGMEQGTQLIKTNKDMGQMYNKDDQSGINKPHQKDIQRQHQRKGYAANEEEEEDGEEEYEENYNEYDDDQNTYDNDIKDKKKGNKFKPNSQSNYDSKHQQHPIGKNKQDSSNILYQSKDNVSQTINSTKKNNREEYLNSETKHNLNEQESNLLYPIDPSLMKNQQMANNQIKMKDKQLKDYDDIINEVKKVDSFRKGFSSSGRIDNSNSRAEFNSRDEENENYLIENKSNSKMVNKCLGQSEEDLKKNLKLKQYENLKNNKSGNSKQKQFNDDKEEKIREDEGLNEEEENDDGHNHNYQNKKLSKQASTRINKGNSRDNDNENPDNQYKISLKKKKGNVKETDQIKESLNQLESNSDNYHLIKSQSNKLKNKQGHHQGYDVNKSSEKRKNKKPNDSEDDESEESEDEKIKHSKLKDQGYDQTGSSSTNVFKYSSKKQKLNQNEPIGTNSNNDTARLGSKDEEESDSYQLPYSTKDKGDKQWSNNSNSKHKSSKKGQFQDEDNQDSVNNHHSKEHKPMKDQYSKEELSTKKKSQYYEYDSEDESNNNSKSNSNKGEFKQLLDQQKNYMNYQKNDKGKWVEDINNNEDGMTRQERKKYQNIKKKPNEINTNNPYNEEYGKHKNKKKSNIREYSPSENTSTEAKRHLKHLYKKKFGAAGSQNPNIHHNRILSMPIVKKYEINPEDTFGYNESSSIDQEQSLRQKEGLDRKNKQGTKGGEYGYPTDKKLKNPLLIKIPNDESIIDLPHKTKEEDEDEEENQNSACFVDNNNNHYNSNDPKRFTLKGYQNENDLNLLSSKINSQMKNNKLSNFAQYIEAEGSGEKSSERIAQLISQIKKNQNQIVDSMTHNDKFHQRKDEEYDSQSSRSNMMSTSNQNNENIYTFSGNQAGTSINNNGKNCKQSGKNQLKSESMESNKSKTDLLNQQNRNMIQNKKNRNIQESYDNNSRNQYSLSNSNQGDGKLSSEQNNISKDYETKSLKDKHIKLGNKNEYINYPKKIENESINNKSKTRFTKNEAETLSSDKGERSNLYSLVSESKSINGKDESIGIGIGSQLKYVGGKLIINKTFMNYFCFLVTNHMKRSVALSCIGKIYYYQLHKEKKFACKIIYRLMKKRIIFYEIKFYYRGKNIFF